MVAEIEVKSKIFSCTDLEVSSGLYISENHPDLLPIFFNLHTLSNNYLKDGLLEARLDFYDWLLSESEERAKIMKKIIERERERIKRVKKRISKMKEFEKEVGFQGELLKVYVLLRAAHKTKKEALLDLLRFLLVEKIGMNIADAAKIVPNLDPTMLEDVRDMEQALAKLNEKPEIAIFSGKIEKFLKIYGFSKLEDYALKMGAHACDLLYKKLLEMGHEREAKRLAIKAMCKKIVLEPFKEHEDLIQTLEKVREENREIIVRFVLDNPEFKTSVVKAFEDEDFLKKFNSRFGRRALYLLRRKLEKKEGKGIKEALEKLIGWI